MGASGLSLIVASILALAPSCSGTPRGSSGASGSSSGGSGGSSSGGGAGSQGSAVPDGPTGTNEGGSSAGVTNNNGGGGSGSAVAGSPGTPHTNPVTLLPAGQYPEWGMVDREGSEGAVLIRTDDIPVTNAVLARGYGPEWLNASGYGSEWLNATGVANLVSNAAVVSVDRHYFHVVPPTDGQDGTGTTLNTRRFAAIRVWSLPNPSGDYLSDPNARRQGLAIVQLESGVNGVTPATIRRDTVPVGTPCEQLHRGADKTSPFNGINYVRYVIPAAIAGFDKETLSHTNQGGAPIVEFTGDPLYCNGALVGMSDHWATTYGNLMYSARFDIYYDAIHTILQQIQTQSAGVAQTDGEPSSVTIGPH